MADDFSFSPAKRGPGRPPRAAAPDVSRETIEPEAAPEMLVAAEDERFDELLTNEEIAEIRAEAAKRWDAEKKKRRKQAYLDAAMDELKAQDGALPPNQAFLDEMNQEVQVFIDMPRLRKVNGGELAPDPIMIDQRIFQPGQYVTVTKAEALYLNDLMDKARRHVRAVDGRSTTYYDERIGQMVYQGGIARGGSGGASFDAIHRRPNR